MKHLSIIIGTALGIYVGLKYGGWGVVVLFAVLFTPVVGIIAWEVVRQRRVTGVWGWPRL